MDKKRLQQLIKALETPAEAIPEKKEHKRELQSSQEDVRLSWLKRYLFTLKEDDEVFFPKFLKYLTGFAFRSEIENFFSLDYQNSDFPSVKLFKQFDPKINPSHLVKDVRSYVLQGFFDAKDMVGFGGTSRFFNAEMKVSSRYKHLKNLSEWKAKLLDLGCDEFVVGELIKSGKVRDYRNLYDSLAITSKKCCSRTTAWELFFLSGEVAAIDYAIEKYSLRCNTRNFWGETPLQIAVFSGRLNAAKHIMTVLPTDPNARSANNHTVLHLAAWRGSVPIIKYLRYLQQTHQLKVDANIDSEVAYYTKYIPNDVRRQQALDALADRSLVQEVELTRLIKDEMREPVEVNEQKSLVVRNN